MSCEGIKAMGWGRGEGGSLFWYTCHWLLFYDLRLCDYGITGEPVGGF